MASNKNDITLDIMWNRVPSKAYQDNYDAIFRKDKKKDDEQTSSNQEADTEQSE